ncbi:MAG: alpha/beta hydrolase [Lachnospiraceae bacterium]|nr:alpha/beta hydrolase [Lachnospiraceae bacterium]
MKNKSIYKSEEGKKQILDLYDAQLKRLNIPYKDLYVDTSFGKTHLIETGNPKGELLLVFHGGNATSAYNLLSCGFLFDDFHIYALDTIGHPGKSAENSLSSSGYDYGKWTGEVIEALGFDKISLFGGSFGGGVIAKTMCAVPDRIKKVFMIIPSGIKNAPGIKSISMLFPMIMYWTTGKEEWLKRTFMPLAPAGGTITDDMYETAKLSIEYTKVKTAMPSNVSASLMKKCKAPTLVMAAELDILFPAKGVLKRAKKIIPNCETYLLENRGHVHDLTEEEKQMIVEFLKEEKR